MKNTAKAGFVLGNDGRVLVQLPADNQFGFVLADEESTWAGGIGSGLTTWTLVDQSQISGDDIERLAWLLENAEVNGTECNHENISHATSSSWESVCADCGEVVDRVQTNQ